MTEVIQVAEPDICEFIRGERDAEQGVPADIDGSDDYNRGYGFRYGMNENKSNGVF